MRTVTVTLGERTWIVTQLTIKSEAKWRRQAEETLAPFWDATGLLDMDISKPSDLRAMVERVGAILDPLAALDALCAYAPELDAEREWLEENTYADEVFGALIALFFGQLRQLERLPQALNGALQPPIPPTSAS